MTVAVVVTFRRLSTMVSRGTLYDRALERQSARSLALLVIVFWRGGRLRLLSLGLGRRRLSIALSTNRRAGPSSCSILLRLGLLAYAGTIMQSWVSLGDSRVEGLALLGRDLELLGSGLAGAIAGL